MSDALRSDPPVAAEDGVTFSDGGRSAIFNLYAPRKHKVVLIGDFNGWKSTKAALMINSKDSSRWWLKIDGLEPGGSYGYQYLVDDSIRIADPYARLVLDPENDREIPAASFPGIPTYPTGKTTGIVSVVCQGHLAYSWKVKNFQRPDNGKLVIYELLIRDFIENHDYQTLTDTLDYLDRLGINAIELLPVNEFEGNDSWGYNTNFLFALDKYYGTAKAYKAFIDACHQRGIAVIQDIVLEDQFGSSPMVRLYADANGAPTKNNPWLNPENRHPYAVGYQMNHESAATKYYTKNVLKYWVKEFHIDGYRLDQAKAFSQRYARDDADWSAYDPSRVAMLSDYYHYLQTLSDDQNELYMILEYFATAQEETTMGNLGAIIWENLNFNAAQATMGYNDAGGSWDLSGLSYTNNQYQKPNAQVAYVESHDEERIQYKNEAFGNSNTSGSYNVKHVSTGLKRDGLLAVFFLATPGAKMIWQFGELGYDISIGQGMDRLRKRPPRWEYLKDHDRKELFALYTKMIHLKKNNAVFNTTHFEISLQGAVKSIVLNGDDGTRVIVVGNFDVEPKEVAIAFPNTGIWQEVLDGTNMQMKEKMQHFQLAPGEYHLYCNRKLH